MTHDYGRFCHPERDVNSKMSTCAIDDNAEYGSRSRLTAFDLAITEKDDNTLAVDRDYIYTAVDELGEQ